LASVGLIGKLIQTNLSVIANPQALIRIERCGAMASNSRLMFQFAAATGLTVMLSAAPAVATEYPVTAREAAASTAKTAPAVIKRHASRGTRIAVSQYDRHDRRVGPIRGNLDCSDVWCGRQFVLMIGVAY
jgi:hypothetical protein